MTEETTPEGRLGPEQHAATVREDDRLRARMIHGLNGHDVDQDTIWAIVGRWDELVALARDHADDGRESDQLRAALRWYDDHKRDDGSYDGEMWGDLAALAGVQADNKGQRMTDDRTVHASYQDMEIVRYDRAGKWYLEPTIPGLKRQHVTVEQAAAAARWGLENGGGFDPALPGGRTFDRLVTA